MRFILRVLSLSGLIILATFWLVGCSGSDVNPVATPELTGAKAALDETDSNRVNWGLWELSFDPSNCTINVRPVRNLQAHYNITNMLLPPACDDCLGIAVNSFDPATRILDCDVSLRNPYQVSGYDVRGILYTNDYGHELRNADGWTGLWEIPGGQDINPFKAFAKNLSNRIFAGNLEHEENYLVYIPIPPQYNAILFAVDASFPGNCKEPYKVTNYMQETIYDIEGSTGNIYVDVHDWQDDVDSVCIAAPEITGEPATQLSWSSGNTWTVEITNNTGASAGDYSARISATSSNSAALALYDYVVITITSTMLSVTAIEPDSSFADWELIDVHVMGSNFEGPGALVKLKMTGEPDISATNVTVIDSENISCDLNIPPDTMVGYYDVEVTNDGGPTATGEDLFEVTVAGFNLVDVTPKWLDFYPSGVYVEGDYAYIAGSYFDFHIFDISNPLDPVWVSSVEIADVWRVAVSNGYAFVLTDIYSTAKLRIIDVDPPESAHVVKTVDLSGEAYNISVNGDYACITAINKKLHIVDINPPLSAYIAKTLDMPDYMCDIAISGEYAYAAVYESGLAIVDFDPPASAQIVNTVITLGNAKVVAVSGEYAYVGKSDGDLDIIDIDPPGSAYVVNTVDDNVTPNALDAFNGYVYIAGMYGVTIYDVDPPELANKVNSIGVGDNVEGIMVTEDYAFVAALDEGFVIIDIDPPETAYIAKSLHRLSWADSVEASNGYAYLFGSDLQVLDCTHLPQTASVTAKYGLSLCEDGVVSGGYAYASASYDLKIFDVDPPETIGLIHTVDDVGTAEHLAMDDGYVYAFSLGGYLRIVDVTVPETAYIVKDFNLLQPGFSGAVTAGNGYVYAYSSGWDPYLAIVDVDPPEDTYVVNTLSTGCWNLTADGYFVYMAGGDDGLEIIDVTSPESAYILNTVVTPGKAMDVAVSGGYAFIADGDAGLQVIDISPPESAYIVTSLGTPGSTSNIAISGGYAFLTDDETTLRIIKLW